MIQYMPTLQYEGDNAKKLHQVYKQIAIWLNALPFNLLEQIIQETFDDSWTVCRSSLGLLQPCNNVISLPVSDAMRIRNLFNRLLLVNAEQNNALVCENISPILVDLTNLAVHSDKQIKRSDKK